MAVVLCTKLSDDFRMFCGDLGNEVTDETLVRAFNRYPSFVKARVVRDKKTNKTKGYGFASFRDPNDFVKAMREMNGKSEIGMGQIHQPITITYLFKLVTLVHFSFVMLV